VAIVTGAARGTGEATARLLVEEGARVVVTDVLDDLGTKVAGELDSAAMFAHLDVTSEADWLAVVDATCERFGSVDVLVNNAGVFSPKPFLDVEEADLDHYLAINLKGTYFTSQAAIPVMQAQGGGAVINVGTVLVDHAVGGFPATAPVASKGAVHALTAQLAAEFGKDNIRVNTVAPGIVRTPIHARNGIENVDDLSGLSLLGRVGEDTEAADAIVHLASAGFTTGVVYPLDGGHTAGHHFG